LVVVPLSTLPNWERELAKWTPQMYVVSMKGNAASRNTIRKYDCFLDRSGSGCGVSSRKRKGQPIRFSVMLTTYEVVVQVGGLHLLY
jgi:SNF2 family DNA or RNA helicase